MLALTLMILVTVSGVVTKPFGFEGRRRMQQALQAIENLRAVVDTLIIVSNDRYRLRLHLLRYM